MNSEPLTLAAVVRERTIAAYEACGHNVSHAAKILGVSRRAFYRLAHRYGLILPGLKHHVLPGTKEQKATARSIVLWAMQQGLSAQPCEVCQSTEKVQAHHDDYSKPLAIRWLCHRHHVQLHYRSQRAVTRST